MGLVVKESIRLNEQYKMYVVVVCAATDAGTYWQNVFVCKRPVCDAVDCRVGWPGQGAQLDRLPVYAR